LMPTRIGDFFLQVPWGLIRFKKSVKFEQVYFQKSCLIHVLQQGTRSMMSYVNYTLTHYVLVVKPM
jgi:hypothetical protein